MNIAEKDIFEYVFYNEQVEPDKRIYIEKNRHLFSDTIDFYSSFLNKLDDDIDNKVKEKFLSDIFRMNPLKVELIEKKIELPEVNNKLKLAAESVKLKVSPVSQTFFDKNSIFMVRFIANKGKTLIYVFSNDDKQLINIHLTLSPSGKRFYMENNQSNLEVEEELTAEKIEMSFDIVS